MVNKLLEDLYTLFTFANQFQITFAREGGGEGVKLGKFLRLLPRTSKNSASVQSNWTII